MLVNINARNRTKYHSACRSGDNLNDDLQPFCRADKSTSLFSTSLDTTKNMIKFFHPNLFQPVANKTVGSGFKKAE